jgi:hypothetical protein
MNAVNQWFSNFFGFWHTVKCIRIFWHTLCTKLKINEYILNYEGVKGVVCGPEGTHLAGACVLSKLG